MRQGVLDYLSGRKDISIGAMDVDVTSVQFNGNKADAVVSFSAKGASGGPGMTMRYQLEQQGNKWAVVGRDDGGHSNAVAPGSPNPHGSGALPESGTNPHAGVGAGGGGGPRMPSPDDLPPTGGKK